MALLRVPPQSSTSQFPSLLLNLRCFGKGKPWVPFVSHIHHVSVSSMLDLSALFDPTDGSTCNSLESSSDISPKLMCWLDVTCLYIFKCQPSLRFTFPQDSFHVPALHEWNLSPRPQRPSPAQAFPHPYCQLPTKFSQLHFLNLSDL